MTNVTKKPGGWSTVRQQLTTWDKPALLALVKELYEAAAENHDFIHARSKIGESGEALEKYRSKIVEQFFPARGDGKLKLGEARKAIRDYRKATGNIPGTAELLMTYVENGTQFTQEYGDIDERFYNAGDIQSFATGWRKWSRWPAASAGDFTISSEMSSRSWRWNSKFSERHCYKFTALPERP